MRFVVHAPDLEAHLVRIEEQLAHIRHLLTRMVRQDRQEAQQMATIGDAVARVEAETATQTTIAESTETLLNELSTIIRSNASDPAAMEALANRLDSASAAGEAASARIQAALVANTPAAATEPAPPVEELPAPPPDDTPVVGDTPPADTTGDTGAV